MDALMENKLLIGSLFVLLTNKLKKLPLYL